jgi:hypothetical protein
MLVSSADPAACPTGSEATDHELPSQSTLQVVAEPEYGEYYDGASQGSVSPQRDSALYPYSPTRSAIRGYVPMELPVVLGKDKDELDSILMDFVRGKLVR